MVSGLAGRKGKSGGLAESHLSGRGGSQRRPLLILSGLRIVFRLSLAGIVCWPNSHHGLRGHMLVNALL